MLLKISPECSKVYENIKFKKENIRFATFKVGQGQEIIVDSTGSSDKTWDDFMNTLPSNEIRYGAFDVEFKNEDNMNISKLIFIYWCPLTGPNIKSKMLYAQGKENFKSTLGVSREIIIDNPSYSFQNVIKTVS